MGLIGGLIRKWAREGKTLDEILDLVEDFEDAGASVPAKAGFALFWKAFPNKVGKGAAEKAYEKAIRLVPQDVLLDGVHRYAAKTDDRPWCNPATWLNQRRWEDEEPQLQLPAPRSGLAAVRARVEREISDGRAPSADRSSGRDVHGGLPLLDQRH